jgi:hypothetical protein
MSNENKRNIQYFEAHSMLKLYQLMESWQAANNKRLLSMSVQRDGNNFCCIALTNPSEVVITSPDGSRYANVDVNRLYVMQA